jgi:hypothetical protein
MAEFTKKNVEEIRIRVGDRTVTPREALSQIAKDPERASKQMAEADVTVVASAEVLESLQTIFGAENVGDDGTIASALTGFEEFLIITAVIGTLSGLAVGYLKGYEDGLAAAADQSAGGDAGGGGDDDGGGEDGGDGEGNGGDGEGEGNGGSDRE